MAPRGKIIRFPGSPPELEGAQGSRLINGRDFVEVYRCDRAEALVLKGLFESEEIPCLLRSRLVHSVHPFSVGDQGEVTILVPESDAPRARRLLARISPGPSFP